MHWALLGGSFFVAIASAFQARLPFSSPVSKRIIASSYSKLGYSLASGVDVSEGAPRDVKSLGEWAANYGVQTSDGFQLIKENGNDGLDAYAITNQDLPQESPILYVPNEVILTGNKAREELGGDAYTAEEMLVNFYGSDHVSQFYLFLKILKEYELGEASPWFQWLDSLPRYYSNGASMSDFCYGCLPPYAAGIALAEKTRLKLFVQALDEVPFLSSESKNSEDVTKWAYAVVNTRSLEMPSGDYCLVPMADYFNHGGYDEIGVSISYDEEGNCYAYSTRDVPAGSLLKISYGDSTNPSKLLARYGFLDDSSPATYCKYIIDGPSPEVTNMGYPDQMLFYSDGSISTQVWDILLYQELGKTSPEQQQNFYQACVTGDEGTKQSYHEQYFPQTLAELQSHVDFLVNELEDLELVIDTKVVRGNHIDRYPRLPLLMRHNEFVKGIFERVQVNLDNMI